MNMYKSKFISKEKISVMLKYSHASRGLNLVYLLLPFCLIF